MSETKVTITDYAETSKMIRARRHSASDRIVFTNGCFDVLHPGHVHLLKYCRETAGPRGIVVVGLNDDDSVMRLKGTREKPRPLLDMDSRALMLSSLRYVDFVVSFSEDTPLELITALRPDVIVKGGDYKMEEVVGRELAVVLIAPTVMSDVSKWSTSYLLEKLNLVEMKPNDPQLRYWLTVRSKILNSSSGDVIARERFAIDEANRQTSEKFEMTIDQVKVHINSYPGVESKVVYDLG